MKIERDEKCQQKFGTEWKMKFSKAFKKNSLKMEY
jgi:hypothetical protein